MGYDYLAILVFALFAVFIPVSFLLTSKMLRPSSMRNDVKNAPYESAEKTIGSGRDIDNEYLPFFALFLPFEIISIVLLLWSIAARNMALPSNILVMGMAAVSTLAAVIGYKLIGDKNA